MWLRSKTVDLSEYLPAFLQSDTEFNVLTDTLSREHERVRVDTADLLNQVIISTATWNLEQWENMLGLTVNPSDTYEQRRNRIIIRLNYKAAATKPFMESLANRFIKNGTATLVEDNEHYLFHFKVDADDMDKLVIDIKGIHEGVDLYKPAHLGYGIILLPERQFTLNAAGRIIKTVIPEKTWTESQEHIVFEAGLNAAGERKTWIESSSESVRHTAYTFGNGTLNGRIRTNAAGHASDMMDAGHDVTETWLTFTGRGMNSRASPITNDAPTKENSRTYHQTEWEDVTSYHGRAMNGAGGTSRTWTTTTTEKKDEMSLSPKWALNRAGKRTVSYQDIGEDKGMTEVLFFGSVTNGGTTETTETKKTVETDTYETMFKAGMNAKTPIRLNNALSVEHIGKHIGVTVERREEHTGAVLNTMRTNAGTPKTVTRVVHVPVWREVVSYTGGALLNSAKHSTYTKNITHTIPGRTEKAFSPKFGVLLNNHAALGYLRL